MARALFGDPVLFVMDEPNSNLDAEGELALDSAIRSSLQRGAAVVVVAHRPSALHAMNELLVLTNGQVAAYGTRDEILKKVSGKPQQSAPPPGSPPNLQIASVQVVPSTRN